jgi:AAA domain
MTIPPPPKLSDVGRRVLAEARERDARKGAQDWEADLDRWLREGAESPGGCPPGEGSPSGGGLTLDEKCTPEVESTGGDVGERISQYEVDQAVQRLRVKDAALRAFRAEQAGPVSRPRPTLLSDLLTEPDEPTRYRIDGLLPVDGRVMLSAQYKAGKTTIRDNLVRCLVDGDPFLGAHPVASPEGRVGVLDLEMPREMIKRWLRDQSIREQARVAVAFLRGRVGSFDVLDPVVRREWAALLRDREVSVLIIDCLRPVLDALGLDENTDAGRVLVAFDQLAEQAGARELIVVHHMGHTGERSRGSSRLRDWPDVEWFLVRKDSDDPASARFFSAYGRDVDVRETGLDYDPSSRHLTLAGGSRRDVDAKGVIPDVIDVLTDQPGLSGRETEQAVIEATGVSRAVARRAVALAVESKAVDTKPGPRRATLHYVNPASAPVRRSAPPVRPAQSESQCASAPLKGHAAHSNGALAQQSSAPGDADPAGSASGDHEETQ